MIYKNCYFTLEEVIKHDFPDWRPNDIAFDTDNIRDTLRDDYGIMLDVPSTSQVVAYTFISTLFDRFYQQYCVKVTLPVLASENVELTPTLCREFYSRMANIISMTQERYLTLLKTFDDNKSNPIGKISSTSNGKTKFNDTPQDAGDFESEEYTSNVTLAEATTESDVGTIMSRLDELYRNWRNVLKDWTNEFIGLFWEV